MASSFVFRSDTSCPELVREVFLSRGFREFEEKEDDDLTGWNIFWRSSHFCLRYHHELRPYQRLTHFPKSSTITRKDGLLRSLRRMQAVYGRTVYDYFPDGYILPNDYTKFVEACRRHSSRLWICKPADLSRGRGISLLRDMNELTYDGPSVVQRYICDPLLVSGYKFDLRLYVAVVSFQPLTIYIHEEGLARFATEKFNLSSLHNVYSHLTNTSINKYSPTYAQGKEGIGCGCKWTLGQLRSYLAGLERDEPLLWQRITRIVMLTLLAQMPLVPLVHNCVELYGFDVLIDEQMKPWLLEVNFSPALHCDCRVDVMVKKPLLNDLIDLLGLRNVDKIPLGVGSKAKTRTTSSVVSRSQNVSRMTSARKKSQSLPSRQLGNFCSRPKTQTQRRHWTDVQETGRVASSKRRLLTACLSSTLRFSLHPSRTTRRTSGTTRAHAHSARHPHVVQSTNHSVPHLGTTECDETSVGISSFEDRSNKSSFSQPNPSHVTYNNTDDLSTTPFLYGTTSDINRFPDGCTNTVYGDGLPKTRFHGVNETRKLPSRVGGFVLVFPFNEATRRASCATTLDIRVITQEIQKEVKQGSTRWAPLLL
ncbi:probable tubulin polyglutamylase TTLL2 [Corticium candelabrum]|uniref:probable tubulin polyglutamylase TTLL2 n=1 Tax=Corticium candelabrum TaxID=121492 RepID=UPI002E254C0B|nr:probable tubulin polyglutamylase TTLL2 [Corticium candelabrum]